MSSVVELHIYGVCNTAVLHDVHSSCTYIHLHIHPLRTSGVLMMSLGRKNRSG